METAVRDPEDHKPARKYAHATRSGSSEIGTTMTSHHLSLAEIRNLRGHDPPSARHPTVCYEQPTVSVITVPVLSDAVATKLQVAFTSEGVVVEKLPLRLMRKGTKPTEVVASCHDRRNVVRAGMPPHVTVVEPPIVQIIDGNPPEDKAFAAGSPVKTKPPPDTTRARPMPATPRLVRFDVISPPGVTPVHPDPTGAAEGCHRP